jgi:hypothetical protein
MPGTTVAECLSAIEASADKLKQAASLTEEWQLVKRAYYSKAKLAHPDRQGGDKDEFQKVPTRWQ